ncbi:GNAT family N-acetyltransferase [Cellulomonas rhizosphaerae]|uniref:GNAT family N-acetyltransferase n=1 Tax=Cellulomonas rhizosphaerae TaxID=2293719 RepID=A0A413RLM9_9CELL|nr:GNAT family N-acetyltransferase [Cellulomonas rhizosphaerae]
MAAEGFDFCLGLEQADSWPAWLERVAQLEAGRDLAPGWVPETCVGGFVGPIVVGRLSVRHRLNAHLALVGGHIGYAVRPGHRRQGYAGAMLRHGLVVAREVGLKRVLVTCSDTNVASARTIERAGGELEDVVATPGSGELKRRYWIPTAH